ncbi:MAG TPA: phage tail protein [Rhodocyclaceae bacterium]|nr:phage tail protein [Rhodocyclaceae bacterium]
MTLRYDVKADVREVERALRGMKNGTATVVTRASNKAIRKAQTAAVRGIAKELPGIRQKRIRSAMSLKLARRTDWTASVSARGARIPIIDLAARQTQRGVTYRTQDGRRLIPGAFIATMSSGHRGAYKRVGRHRLPIVELYGPSIPRVFVQERVERPMDQAAREEWAREALRQIELLRTQQGLR